MVRPKYRKFVTNLKEQQQKVFDENMKELAILRESYLKEYEEAKQKWLMWSEGSFYYDHYLAVNGVEKAQAMVKDLKVNMLRLATLAGIK